jgi:hypothetical protein
MIKVRIDGKDKWLNDAEFAEYRAKQEKKNLARRAAEKAKRLAAKAKEDKHKAKLQRAKDARFKQEQAERDAAEKKGAKVRAEKEKAADAHAANLHQSRQALADQKWAAPVITVTEPDWKPSRDK